MEIGLVTSILLMEESQLKSVMILRTQQSVSAYTHEKKQIIAKIVDMLHAMLDLLQLHQSTRNICDFAHKNVINTQEMMDS